MISLLKNMAVGSSNNAAPLWKVMLTKFLRFLLVKQELRHFK